MLQKTNLNLPKFIFYLFFAGLNIILFSFLSVPDIWVHISFAANLILILILLFSNIHNPKFDLPQSCVILFTYAFFFVAPVLQVNEGRFPNTMAYSPVLVVKANFMIFVFTLIYAVAYYIFKAQDDHKANTTFNNIPVSSFYIILGINIIILVIFFNAYLSRYTGSGFIYIGDSKTSHLIITKFLFLIPIFLVGYTMLNRENFQRQNYFFFLILSICLFMWFINPLVTFRNTLGPAYAALVFAIFRKHFNNNLRAFSCIFLILVVGFPLTYRITHGYYGLYNLTWQVFDINIFEVYTQIHYDAYANFCGFIEYVDRLGYSNGYQLLGSLLFFIPRSIWLTKPLGSGQLIGGYLMQYHDMWFDNISAPFIAEGFVNFGITGIAIFALLLAYINKLVYSLLQQENSYGWFIGTYISVYLLFLLRGDFMSSLSYLIGMLLASLALPKLVSKLSSIKFGCLNTPRIKVD